MMHHEIMRKEALFSEFYESTFSDCLSNIYNSVSEDDNFSEYSSESDNVIIRPTQRQKKITLVIDSDMESENKTHNAGENFTSVSSITTDCNNP